MKKVFKNLFLGLMAAGVVFAGCKLDETDNSALLAAAAAASAGSGSGSGSSTEPVVTISATGVDENGKCVKGSEIYLSATSTVEDVTFHWYDIANNDLSDSFKYVSFTKTSSGKVMVPSSIGTYMYTAVAVRNDNNSVKGMAKISITTTDGDVSNAVLKEIRISDVSFEKGASKEISVTGIYTEGNSESTKTVDAELESSDASVFTVSGKTLTAVAEGSATLTAKYEGKTATAVVTVILAGVKVTKISVAPESAELEAGNTTKLVTTATYNNGSTSNVTTSYTSSNEAYVKVSADGTITAVAAGSAVITATYEGFTATCNVTVNPASNPVVSIAAVVGTTNNSIATNGSANLVVTATYKDNSTKTVSPESVTFENDKVSRSGNTIIAGNTAGTCVATVTYTEGDVTVKATVTITVEAKQLKSLAVTAEPTSIAYNGTSTLKVTATYDDNSTGDVTSSATLTSDSNVLTIAKMGSGATATANNTENTAKTVTVTAEYAGKTAECTVNVAEYSNPVTGITAKVGTDNTIIVNSSADVVVTATYKDGTTKTVIPTSVTLDNTKATVSGAKITAGDTAGSCVATVKYTEGDVTVTATVTITVAAKQLKSIAVTATPTSIACNGTSTLKVTATYEDDTTADVTADATLVASSNVLTITKNGSSATATANNTSTSAVVVTVTATFASTASPKTATVDITVGAAEGGTGSGTIGFDFN